MSVRADITLTLDGNDLGTLKDAALQISMDTIGAAPEDEYGWDEDLPATRSWGAQGSLFIPLRGSDTALDGLKQAYVERSTLSASIDFQGTTESGTAFVTNINMSGSVGGALEGTLSLQGTGEL